MKNSIKKLAIIGPNANEARLGGGGSASVTPFYSVSPLEGMQNLLGDKVELIYSEGCGLNGNLTVVEDKYLVNNINGVKTPGLVAKYYTNRNLDGDPHLISKDAVNGN